MNSLASSFRRVSDVGLILLTGFGLWGLDAADRPMGGEVNLVRNHSFEEVERNRPSGWRPQSWGGEGSSQVANVGHSGDRSVLLSSSEGADLGWTANVSVEPFGRYRLSGWIKTEGLELNGGRGALLNLHNIPGVATPAVTGSQDWTEVKAEFEVEDLDSVQVNCLLGGWGLATGKAWFDDVRLEKIGELEAPSPMVTVHADEVSAPMSVNIYGQFIEHLGRCIYGGIWAEMLEDRKFYHPIQEEYAPYTRLRNTPFPVVGASPWELTGERESVLMDETAPFVGRHTPVVSEGTGIRQHDLGVTQGKTYVGHLWAKAPEGERASLQVTLRWGERSVDCQTHTIDRVRDRYRRFTFEFTAGQTTDEASLEVRASTGTAYLGTVSLMPADHVEGMRADTLALLRELKAPIYRWPGGNFVSGYDWRDGVGDRDRRPPRTNPAWTGVEHNDFGMHEFIRFCELVEAEPWITVNTGFGDAYSAAAQLEYCNGSKDTPYGGQRAENGAKEPFDVRYWGVGNEMWGTWQLGYMRLEHYVLKQNWVVDKMREVDPDIICIASGNAGPWSMGLLENCSDHMDYIAEHFYSRERSGLRSHVRQIPDNIRRKADFLRNARQEIPGLEDTDIRISMTEWNYWYGPHVFGELGTRYFLKDGLGIAAGLHEFARQSDVIESAFYAQTVNVIGCIKTSRRNAAFETTGLVLKLYREHFGRHPVKTEVAGLLDAQAAWSEDRKVLSIGVVNPTLKAVQAPLILKGAKLKGPGRKWRIAGSDPMAHNDPDEAPRVVIESEPLTQLGKSLHLSPCSVTLYTLETE